MKTGNLTQFLFTLFGILAVFYAAIFFLIFACQGRHGENWRALLESLLHPVPVLGKARRELALSRLAAALEALLNAGVSIFGAWELAAAASGSPAIRRTVKSWRPRLETGSTPSELVSESGCFTPVFKNLYHSGEISGKLDETLKRLHAMYQEEGFRHMRLVARWSPQLAYFAFAIYIGYRIVSFYLGYFSMLNDIKF
jgi:protein transport protein HofC